MRQENRPKRIVKKSIDEEITLSVTVGVNFTTRGNLTLQIKDLNDITMKKLKSFGTLIAYGTWHKAIFDALRKDDLIEAGELICAKGPKAKPKNRNNIESTCPPHTIETKALKGDKANHLLLIVALWTKCDNQEILGKGILLINQHCHAGQWLPKTRTTLTRLNEMNNPTNIMELKNTKQFQFNANKGQ